MQGRGRLIVTFSENSAAANAYRGELLGIMAIHLLLLSVHMISLALQGSVKIYSDCLGALGKVADLPPNWIPTRCRHSDILKMILVNCSGLPFSCIYEHVKAHQYDDVKYDTLLRQSQLNCYYDGGAKSKLGQQISSNTSPQQPFPLETICIFVNAKKMKSDIGAHIRFSAHCHLAKKLFSGYKILFAHQFEQVDWPNVQITLSEKVPKPFQLWACKKVMRIAPTNKYISYRDNRCTKCPGCTVDVETTNHILL